MKFHLKGLLPVLVLGAAATVRADMTIDNFRWETDPLVLGADRTFGRRVTWNDAFLGGKRILSGAFEYKSPGGDAGHTIAQIDDGALRVDQDWGAESDINLRYGYSSRDRSFLGDTGIHLMFLGNSRPLDVRYGLVDSSGRKLSGMAYVGPSFAGEESLQFSEANVQPLFDLQSVASIDIHFETLRGGDFSIAKICAVPEPGGAVAFAVGAIGIFGRRRRS